jgi:dolichol-phosphate mannosyltransferase
MRSNPTLRPAPVPDLLSLVIPVFNERESLPILFDEIVESVRSLGGMQTEVIFVDDGSTDGSWEVIRELTAVDPRVRGVRFRKNFGKAAALAAGFARTSGSVVMTLDADLQDDPHEIPRFLAAVKSGTDVVSGWKKIRHDPWHKVLPSRFFNWIVSRVTGVKLHDHNCGFKAYRAEVVREVRLYGEFHRFIPVLADAEGFSVGELVINHRPRKFGYSKFGTRRFIKGFLDLITVKMLTGFGRRPKHFLGSFGLIAALIGVFGTIICVSLASLGLSEEWTRSAFFTVAIGFVFSLVALLIGVQAFLAGLLAEYALARTATDEPYRIAEALPEPPTAP